MLVKVVAEILLAEIRGLDNVVARYYYDTIQRRLSILTLLILLLLPCQSAHLNLHYFPLLFASVVALYSCPCGYLPPKRKISSQQKVRIL